MHLPRNLRDHLHAENVRTVYQMAADSWVQPNAALETSLGEVVKSTKLLQKCLAMNATLHRVRPGIVQSHWSDI